MKKILSTFILIVVSQIGTSALYAFTIEKNNNVPIEKNFVVGPAKIESEIVAGTEKSVRIVIDNKTGRSQKFSISFEDFIAGSGEEVVTLLGEKSSQTSLKNFLSVEQNEFTLEHGDRAIVPVQVRIPSDAQSGGKFASVVVSAITDTDKVTDGSRAYTGAVVVGRIATLLFVTVPGDTKAEGALVSVTTKNNKKIFFDQTVPLRVLSENTGTVSLNPYGIVRVKNMFGREVSSTVLDPWFTLPGSVRTRDIDLQIDGGLGFYSVEVSVNRGYEDIVDERKTSFVILSPYVLVMTLVTLLLGVFVLTRMFRKAKQA